MSAKKDDWMKEKWRPAMGWMYMVVCITDFVLFPVLWSVIQAIANGGQVTNQWNPLTLQGAGLFHMAMGAVLGVAAWSRGQEKMAGVAVDRSYGQPYYDPEPAYQSSYVNTGRTFVSRNGKIGPVIEEPEL